MKQNLFVILFISHSLFFASVATADLKAQQPTQNVVQKTETEAPSNSATPTNEEKGLFWRFLPEGEWLAIGNLGGRWVDDETESARFNEYRDITDWVYGSLWGFYNKDNRYFNLTAIDIARDDQFYKLSGGGYQDSKYEIYYDQLPHLYSFHDRTIYTAGLGTSFLTYVNPTNAGGAGFVPNVPTDSNTWNRFEYVTSLKNLGGSYNAFISGPLSISVGANQVWRDGLKPAGVSSGVKTSQTATVSPQGHVIEYPEPIDFSTTNVFSSFDYKWDNLFTSLDLYYSNFTNDIDYITWRNPFVTTQILNEVSSIAPDNDYFKIDLKGTLREIPIFDSSFAFKGSYAFLLNEMGVLNTIADYTPHSNVGMPTYLTTTLLLNRPTFEGNIAYWNASGILTSNPLKNLDTRVWAISTIKENHSTPITFTDASTATSSTSESIFQYVKLNTGVKAGYNLPGKNRLTAGYDLHWINRAHRPDVQATTDNKVEADLRNTYFDFLTLKLEYSFAERNSTFTVDPAFNGTGPTANNGWINRFFRKFDVSDRKQNIATIGVELYPCDNLDIGLEYAFKRNRYYGLALGRLKDRMNAGYADATYTIPHFATITGYFSLENLKTEALRRRFGSTNSADPNTPPTTAAYNWGSDIHDDGYAYGVILEMPFLDDRLDFIGSWEFEKSRGSIAFFPQNNIVTLVNVINRYDSYRKNLLQVKGIYNLTKRLTTTLGYMFERFNLYDYLFDGYQFFGVPSNGSQWFLTGAYNDHDYSVSVIFAEASYIF